MRTRSSEAGESGTRCKHKFACLSIEKNVLHICEANFIPNASTGQAFEKIRDQLTVKSGSWDVERRMVKHQETTYGRSCASPTNLHKTHAWLQA